MNTSRNTQSAALGELRDVDASMSDAELEALNGGGVAGAGVGLVAGLWSGAAGGTIAGGPVGALIGGLGGALVGGLTGALSKD